MRFPNSLPVSPRQYISSSASPHDGPETDHPVNPQPSIFPCRSGRAISENLSTSFFHQQSIGLFHYAAGLMRLNTLKQHKNNKKKQENTTFWFIFQEQVPADRCIQQVKYTIKDQMEYLPAAIFSAVHLSSASFSFVAEAKKHP